MLELIGTNLFACIFDSAFASKLEEKKCKMFERKLKGIIPSLLKTIEGTSLECSEFRVLTESFGFKKMTRLYFLANGKLGGRKKYFLQFEEVISNSNNKFHRYEIRRFLQKYEEIHNSIVMEIIVNDKSLNALFMALSESHSMIIDYLDEFNDELKKLLVFQTKNESTINKNILDKYHNVKRSLYDTISFSGIRGAESLRERNFSDLYVKNNFSIENRKNEFCIEFLDKKKYDSFSIDEVLNINNKLVVLGGAGFGKTTSMKYLFTENLKKCDNGEMKFFVNLPKYTKSGNFVILESLCTELESAIDRSSLTDIDLSEAISKKLYNGNCLIIFDGLDEISSEAIRNDVRCKIQEFCLVYPANKYIITSREVGYLSNKFNNSFTHLRILNFDDDQIKEYVTIWNEINNKDVDGTLFYNEFIEAVKKSNCKQLIEHPIILVIALIVFKSEKKLPNKRAEFYSKCIETFLEKRENLKDTNYLDDKTVSMLSDDMILPSIANMKYDKSKIDSERNELKLYEIEEMIKKCLGIIDNVLWNKPTKEFVKYLVERTELIQEVDMDYYDFSHKTFYEYFLATYFVKSYSYEELICYLEEFIGDSNNDEIAKLIIEIAVKENLPQKHTAIVEFLIESIYVEFNLLKNSRVGDKQFTMNNVGGYISILTNLYNTSILKPKYQEEFCNIWIETLKLFKLDFRYSNNIVFPNSWLDIQSTIERYYEDRKITIKEIVELYTMKTELKYTTSYNFANEDIYKVVNEISYRHSDMRRNDLNLEYFISYYIVEKKELYDGIPMIYLCLTTMYLTENDDSEVNESMLTKLLNYKYDKNSLFTKYGNSDDARIMIKNCLKSEIHFALFCKLVFSCFDYLSKRIKNESIISFFENEMHDKRVSRNDDGFDAIKKQLLLINSILYQPKTCHEFIDNLEKHFKNSISNKELLIDLFKNKPKDIYFVSFAAID